MVLPGNCAETPVVEIESRAVLSVPQPDLWELDVQRRASRAFHFSED